MTRRTTDKLMEGFFTHMSHAWTEMHLLACVRPLHDWAPSLPAGLGRAVVLTWWLRVPRANALANRGCYLDLLWPSLRNHITSLPGYSVKVIQVCPDCPDARGGDLAATSQWEEYQKICNYVFIQTMLHTHTYIHIHTLGIRIIQLH